jgi:MSHA biogenesis protein MshP
MTAVQKILRPRARGFALMMAVFMIITLAAIAVYLLTISTGQLEAGVQDEQGTRAYQAARTGVDWGAYQLRRNFGVGFAASCPVAPASFTQILTLGQGLNGFCSKVECKQVGSEREAATEVRVYQLTVTGYNRVPAAALCNATTVGPAYVERQLQLTLTCEFPTGSPPACFP